MIYALLIICAVGWAVNALRAHILTRVCARWEIVNDSLRSTIDIQRGTILFYELNDEVRKIQTNLLRPAKREATG